LPDGLSRSRSNTASPFSSQQTASPPIRHEHALSPAAASTMVGKRPVQSLPLRVSNLTPDMSTAHHHAVAVVL
jgi:hypothetical protein